jgi:acetyl-CoA C-acetyltransferase
LGVEKLKDTGYGGLPATAAFGQMQALIGPNATAPGLFAQLATSYFAKYGIDPAAGKKALAHISAKSHANGAMNPKAHLRRPVTEEQIINAPMIAYPLGLFDCCGVSDGAAAAIVTTPEIARSLRKQDPVLVKAIAICVSSGEESLFNTWDGAHLETTCRAGQMAFQEAGIKNPREEISMMEVHDCFSITELTVYEDLQISPRGRAIDDIKDGFFDLKGKIPCQPDGGLKCFGHPIGASGLRMLYEMYNQLLERWPEERRVKNPRMGLTHNLGGIPATNVCSIAIIGR